MGFSLKSFTKPFKSFVGVITNGVLGGVYDAWKAAGDWVTDLLKPEEADQNQGTTVNKSSASASIPIVYGRMRVGGTRVYLSSRGDKNKYLYSVLVQCEGEVQSVQGVTISDKASSKFGSKLVYTAHLGLDNDSADSRFVSELGDWTNEHRLQGIVYCAVRYEYDQDLYSGLPNFESIIEGRKLFDPRSGQTNFSDNHSLVCLLYTSDAADE